MPISRREFGSNESNSVFLVLDFFYSNSDQAYTLEELINELALRGVNLELGELKDILRTLEERGRIESKTKKGVVYYIYHKPKLGFRA